MTHTLISRMIEVILKLFSLEVKDNDHMLVTTEVREIMYKIEASSMKTNLPFATFVKSLYYTDSNYL